MRSFWINKKHATLQKLTYEFPFLTKDYEAAQALDTVHQKDIGLPRNGNMLTSGRQEKRRQGNFNSILSSTSGKKKRTQSESGQELELSTHLEDTLVQDVRHHDLRLRSLQMTCHIVAFVCHSCTVRQNVPWFLPSFAAKSKKLEQPILRGC